MRRSWSSLVSFFVLLLVHNVQLVDASVQQRGITTITDVDGETLATSVSPTVYTTEGETYTFVPSTPPVPTPSIRSRGSVQNLRDYVASRSIKGIEGSQHPATATAVVGDGGQPKNNLAQSPREGGERAVSSSSSRMTKTDLSLTTTLAAAIVWYLSLS